MFSGIVETESVIKELQPRANVLELVVERPATFDDVKTGDSIAVNGVCLTVESLTQNTIRFAIADETLNITNWKDTLKTDVHVNLERSLKWGDRVHGHLVQGHVDGMGAVTLISRQEESLILHIRLPQNVLHYVWKKGSLTVNGVSLTINSVENDIVSFCLIPETLKRTNLKDLSVGSPVCIEADSLARYFERQKELNHEHYS